MVVVKDPVCGMVFVKEDAAGKTEYKNETYYFCAPSCKKFFETDPEKYLAASNVKKNTNNKNETNYHAGESNEKDNGIREHD